MSKYSRRNKKNKAFKTHRHRAKPKRTRRNIIRHRRTRTRRASISRRHVRNFNPPIVVSAPSASASADMMNQTNLSPLSSVSPISSNNVSVISPPWSVNSPEILNTNNTSIESVSPLSDVAEDGVIFMDNSNGIGSQNGSLHLSDLETAGSNGTTVEESPL